MHTKKLEHEVPTKMTKICIPTLLMVPLCLAAASHYGRHCGSESDHLTRTRKAATPCRRRPFCSGTPCGRGYGSWFPRVVLEIFFAVLRRELGFLSVKERCGLDTSKSDLIKILSDFIKSNHLVTVTSKCSSQHWTKIRPICSPHWSCECTDKLRTAARSAGY